MVSREVVAAVILGALSFCPGCRDGGESLAGSGGERGALAGNEVDSSSLAPAKSYGVETPRAVVVYLIDTLRADHLGTYGYGRDTSPNVDALGRESVVFERAHAPGPWTLPSVVSIHTSTFLSEHGVLVGGARVGGHLRTLAERLKDLGLSTASFVVNPYGGEFSGLDRGFDLCRSLRDPVGAEVVAPWLDSLGSSDRFFLSIHNVEPHDPWLAELQDLTALEIEESSADRDRVQQAYQRYRKLTRVDFGFNRKVQDRGLDLPMREIGETDNTEEQRAALELLHGLETVVRGLYDARIREADRRLGELVDRLKREDRWEETLFILVSDHGEELNDRGGWQHDHSVYEELLRVPCLIKFPGGSHGGTRISEVVSLVDLFPTILHCFDVAQETIESCRGRSVLPLLKAEGSTSLRVTSMRRNLKKYFRPYRESRGEFNIVLCEGGWKGIYNRDLDTFELYDLRVDPSESNDRSGQDPDRVRRMIEHALDSMTRWGEAETRSGTSGFSDEAVEGLKRLGYLEGDSEEP